MFNKLFIMLSLCDLHDYHIPLTLRLPVKKHIVKEYVYCLYVSNSNNNFRKISNACKVGVSSNVEKVMCSYVHVDMDINYKRSFKIQCEDRKQALSIKALIINNIGPRMKFSKRFAGHTEWYPDTAVIVLPENILAVDVEPIDDVAFIKHFHNVERYKSHYR